MRKCLCCRAEPVVLWGCCQAARGAERGQNWGQALAPCPSHHPSASGTHPGVVSLWGHSLQPLHLSCICSPEVPTVRAELRGDREGNIPCAWQLSLLAHEWAMLAQLELHSDS